MQACETSRWYSTNDCWNNLRPTSLELHGRGPPKLLIAPLIYQPKGFESLFMQTILFCLWLFFSIILFYRSLCSFCSESHDLFFSFLHSVDKFSAYEIHLLTSFHGNFRYGYDCHNIIYNRLPFVNLFFSKFEIFYKTDIKQLIFWKYLV